MTLKDSIDWMREPKIRKASSLVYCLEISIVKGFEDKNRDGIFYVRHFLVIYTEELPNFYPSVLNSKL